MKTRCFDKNNNGYKNYGGRGITVCRRWLGKKGFQNLCEDIGKRPKGKSIDRIDNNGNYEPKNCHWATPEQQQNNTRISTFVSVNGVQIPFKELAEMFGLNRGVLYQRIFTRNWNLKRALTTKIR